MSYTNTVSKHITVSSIVLFIMLIIINIGFSIVTAIKYISFFELLVLALVNIGIILFLFKIIANNKLITISEAYFIALIGAFTVVIGLITILFTDNILIIDPKTYNDVALEYINEGHSPNFTNVMWRRTVLYLIPIYSFLPQTLISVKLTNLFLSLLTTLGFYSLLKTSKLSLLISRISVILFTLIPLRYSNMNIPSHDIMGLFLFILFSILIFKLIPLFQKRSYFNFFLLAFVSGIILFALNIQRSSGIFIILTLIFTYLFNEFYKNRKLKYAILASLIIIFATYFTSNYLLKNGKY